MVLHSKKVRGLGLCSGGLDSILAGLVLRETGIDVEWISFETPFFSSNKAQKASKNTGIHLYVKNITSTYLKMLKNPNCGYGQHMNPCMDCHALMFKLAGELMQEKGFDFLFSGEVMGQRPMSQTKSSLRYVEKHSGFDGYIVRPLSIQKLPQTIPEKQGLVNRNLLYGITGRSRKPQMEIAEKLGITDYPSPAGGCLLTDKNYSIKLKDLFDHQSIYTENELHLLKYGRHFRISDNCKIIVGRHKKDNENILKYYTPKSHVLIQTVNIPGPVVIMTGDINTQNIKKSAGICIGYSKASNNTETDVNITTSQGCEIIKVKAILPDAVKKFMI